jgi:hypothetical protein
VTLSSDIAGESGSKKANVHAAFATNATCNFCQAMGREAKIREHAQEIGEFASPWVRTGGESGSPRICIGKSARNGLILHNAPEMKRLRASRPSDFPSVYRCFRILPGRCHSKCHSRRQRGGSIQRRGERHQVDGLRHDDGDSFIANSSLLSFLASPLVRMRTAGCRHASRRARR